MTDISFKVNLFRVSKELPPEEITELMRACFGEICELVELYVEETSDDIESCLSGTYCLRMKDIARRYIHSHCLIRNKADGV